MSDYPKAMIHPHAVKGQAKPVTSTDSAGRNVTDYFGTADKYPPVTVQNADQEAEHRAKGYYLTTDKVVSLVYQDYPVWMKHEDGREILAKDAAEETKHSASGFERKGSGNPEAVQRAFSAPYDPEFEASEWPKMVDGVLMQDPTKNDAADKLYPMWVGAKLVSSEAEEREARGGMIFRDGKLVGEVEKAPEAPTDPRRDALVTLAKLKGLDIADDTTADEIEATLFSTPAAVAVGPVAAQLAADPAPPVDEKKALIAEAESKGVTIDKRWNAVKIRDALAAA